MFFSWGCNRQCLSHRQKLLIIILDTIFRINYLYITSFVYSLTIEIVYTNVAYFQFYIILTSLIKSNFLNKNFDNRLDTPEIKYPFLTSILFFCFWISLNISKLVSLIQHVFALIACLMYAIAFLGKIQIFMAYFKKNIWILEKKFHIILQKLLLCI